MRNLLLLLTALLPSALKVLVYRHVMKWQIGKNVKVGLSYIDGDTVILGNNVSIGHLNVIRCFKHFEMGEGAYLRTFNQFFGRRDNPNWPGQLVIGKYVKCMSNHFIDACGRVVIGRNTTIAGRSTHFWSHSMLFEGAEPMLSPLEVYVGEHVYIGAGAKLVGCSIPNHAVIGAGSVVTKSFEDENCRILIAGNPGVIKKRYGLVKDQKADLLKVEKADLEHSLQ